ncbi:UDP-arabinose 4-epimerase [Musa troglodytarum]|uniref:UDP-arabinose 4-epimerase n=1 Tax=Musa troglodytarum TaxID=320322 RepID=A0A9E7HDE5_9LILI|nr:UDP-arabinose 4-epimerase [Musa troglodytarum]
MKNCIYTEPDKQSIPRPTDSTGRVRHCRGGGADPSYPGRGFVSDRPLKASACVELPAMQGWWQIEMAETLMLSMLSCVDLVGNFMLVQGKEQSVLPQFL